MAHSNSSSSMFPLFVNATILPLNFLYYESVCNLMYDVNNNIAPTNILNLFSRTSSIHSYNTRSSTSENFYIKKSRLDVQKDAFSRVGAKIWNEIPNYLKKLSKKAFKKELKEKLLEILKNEDSYIGIPTISQKTQELS